MSQKNGFGSGFILGSVVGGIVGGLLGTVLASRGEKGNSNKDDSLLRAGTEIPFSDEENIELARHGLEDKIAQLNLAIDDVRQQLGSVNSNSGETE
jgi:gas vesicle protein